MKSKSNKMKFLTLAVFALGFILANANFSELFAQSGDPFSKPVWARPKDPNAKPVTTAPSTGATTTAPVKAAKPLPPPVVQVGAPAIQDRVNYYKKMRETAALNGEPLPKLTSVLTLDEMTVTGIFRTPRGYAAIVQATPVGMSYTVYPGEKFFNGQLVAVEENRLVFRKVIKMSNGKFITSEENKTLREYTQQEEIQGTAPIEGTSASTAKPAETVPTASAQPGTPTAPATPSVVVSPLDEMNKQPVESATVKAVDKTKKGKAKASATKKPVKVAGNKKQ
jgi:hypothetical protein